MKSSLPNRDADEGSCFPYADCPEVFDENETVFDEDEPYPTDEEQLDPMDEHYARLAYGYVPRSQQSEIYRNFKNVRRRLKESFDYVRRVAQDNNEEE
jgi:hypothetical protein